MDRLQELCTQVGGKIKVQNNYNMNLNAKSLRRLVVSSYRKSSRKVEVEEYGDIFLVGLKVNSKFAFSINKPDLIFGYDKEVTSVNANFPVYTSDGQTPFRTTSQARFFEGLFIWLNNLRLADDETVFVYNNYMYVGIHANRDLVSAIDALVDLVSAHKDLFQSQEIRFQASNQLPVKLQVLYPLMDQWAKSDDSDRVQLVASMDKVEREVLIAAVDPLIEDINGFLDSFKDSPLSEEAMRLGNLAELVSELKLNV
jgi:hypothetical protein